MVENQQEIIQEFVEIWKQKDQRKKKKDSNLCQEAGSLGVLCFWTASSQTKN